jgi:hypothetical protein
MEWEFVMGAKHTPTPWLIEGGCVYAPNLEGTNRFSLIVHGGWQTAGVYRTDADELQANAAFIVRACNSHDALVEALRALLNHADRETCVHESTHRGGAIWTICDGCGMKWADDRGGFVPHTDAVAVAQARAALALAGETP